ncbi:MAG TPA: HAMP domain-containing sensor histidine kinase [Alphaproteobacteria bacterium]|nr:HAMP domain-containing sensor histidine kinase [Alphaproteobacteria bacterium]
MPAALVAQIGMIFACAIVLWSGPARGPWLAAWAGLSILVTFARSLLLWGWSKSPLEVDEARRRRRLLVIGAAVSGGLWGILPVLIRSQAPIEHEMFLGVVLAGMCAGALAALGYVRATFYAFVLPALLPFAIVMLIGGGPMRTALGLLALLFLGSLAFIARTLEQVVIGAFRLQHANAALVRRLTVARDEANAAAEAKSALISSLEDSRREAESANQAKSTFLAIMSHELRTPLNAIIGFADVIRAESLGPLENPRYREYVSDIRDSGAHLLELINKILDLSKIEAGKFELSPERFSVEPVIASVLRLFREQASAAGVRLELHLDPTGLTVRADERALKQMLINLISNALKFAPRGTTITVSAAGGTHGTEISISDRGAGIAPGDIEKAIAPFSQLGDPMTRRHEGTGLGLSLVKALVSLHGGNLIIESRPGSGTTVRLMFPDTGERRIEAPGTAMREVASH